MNKLRYVKQLSTPRLSGCILDLNTRNHKSEIFQEVKMNAEDQNADSQQQPKSRSESFYLSRCAGCYKQVGSVHWRGGDGESSSSAEDSGPEVDLDSDTESSSSSCCSMRASPETPEEPERETPPPPPPACGDAAEPQCGGEDGDQQEEETSENQADTSRTKEMRWRAPLIKSFSLPASFTPNLIPQSRLPRPHTVVSTLHLQVLSQKHNDDVSYILYEREDEKTGRRGGVDNLLHPRMGVPWQRGSQPALQQHQLSYQQLQLQQHQQLQQQQHQQLQLHQHHKQLQHQQLQHQQLQHQQHQQLHHQHQQLQRQQHQQQLQHQQLHQLQLHQHQLLHPYQQQQPQRFPPLSAQGQRLPPPTHTFSLLHPPTHHTPLQISHPPQTHLHTPAPPTCWCCYSVAVPHSGLLPR